MISSFDWRMQIRNSQLSYGMTGGADCRQEFGSNEGAGGAMANSSGLPGGPDSGYVSHGSVGGGGGGYPKMQLPVLYISIMEIKMKKLQSLKHFSFSNQFFFSF